MNGFNILADTSLLINFFNGYRTARDILEEEQIWLSCITEIELLWFPSLSEYDANLIKSFLSDCVMIELSKPIREQSIVFKKQHKLKTPDAIIAATAYHLDFPLVTMDSDFKKVTEIKAMIVE